MSEHKHRCGHATPQRYRSVWDRLDPPPEQQPGCGLVFEHEEPPEYSMPDQRELMHTCTNCGVVTYWRYYGRKKAGEGIRKPKELTT